MDGWMDRPTRAMVRCERPKTDERRRGVDRYATQNSAVYVGVIVAGALVGEKAINYGFDRAWERANAGKLWKDVEKRLELE